MNGSDESGRSSDEEESSRSESSITDSSRDDEASDSTGSDDTAKESSLRELADSLDDSGDSSVEHDETGFEWVQEIEDNESNSRPQESAKIDADAIVRGDTAGRTETADRSDTTDADESSTEQHDDDRDTSYTSSLRGLADSLRDSTNTTGGGDENVDITVDNARSDATAHPKFATLDETDSVLLLAARDDARNSEICTYLAMHDDPLDLTVLTISATKDIDDLIELWSEHAPVVPQHLSLVRIGGTPSQNHVDVLSSLDEPTDVSVKNLPDPNDLARLGITTGNVLSSLEQETDHIAVCFDAITPLLQYVDNQRLFRFLHVLQSRFDNAGVTAHYHIDPTAHTDETIGIYRTLFDTVVDISGESTDIT